MRSVYHMQGVGQKLDVYEDRVEIRTTGLAWTLAGGLQGTKAIPLSSITAVKLKESGFATNGVLQFAVIGGGSNSIGYLGSPIDENSFVFSGDNRTARKISQYIQTRMSATRTSPTGSSLAQEIEKLAELRQRGVLSEGEFQSAKRKLVS